MCTCTYSDGTSQLPERNFKGTLKVPMRVPGQDFNDTLKVPEQYYDGIVLQRYY